MNTIKAFQGNAFYSMTQDTVKYLENCLICLTQDGVISRVYQSTDQDFHAQCAYYAKQGTLKTLSPSQFMLPGFVDLHIHASQWPQAGTALDAPLETWLGEYTFPLESEYKDLDFANIVYTHLVQTTLAHGTTTALHFASVDTESSLLLAKICGKLGQRGLVGKVVMDDPNTTPNYCRDASAQEAVEETKRFLDAVYAMQDDYAQGVYPVITPRFIPSCSDEALMGLGQLARQYDAYVQTHCSESDWEHQFVIQRYGKHDSFMLDHFGLIGRKTILAHAPFLSAEDITLLSQKGASIAHCPLSNAYFANAVYPLVQFSKQGLKCGLATDISGGYTPSMYQAIRQSVISSRMLECGVNPELPQQTRGKNTSAITLNHGFYAATVGGGLALDLPIGKFEPGYYFDMQIINTTHNIPLFHPEKTPENLLHKILLLIESSNIEEVFVKGNKVK